MNIYEEIESLIAELPTEQKISIKLLLNQIESVRRQKQAKSFDTALHARFEFESNGRDSSLN